MSVDKIWQPDELASVLIRARSIFGSDLDRLLRKYASGRASRTRPRYEHRLVRQLSLLARAVAEPANALVQDAASVVIVEVDGTIEAFEDWSSDPVWPEFRRAVLDPRESIHASTTLVMASALKEHHPAVKLVASPRKGRAADLTVLVTDNANLGVEVKTSPKFSSHTLLESDAIDLVSDALSSAGTHAGGQLGPDRPGVLVVGGTQIDGLTFERLHVACNYWSRNRLRFPAHLLGVVATRLFFKVGVVNQRVQVVLSHESRIVRNPRYSGTLDLIGDWGGDWSLVPRVPIAS